MLNNLFNCAYANIKGKMDFMKKIVLTGGGTAGHIYPALAVRERLSPEIEVHFIGGNGMEKDILKNEKNISFHQIRTVKLERKLTAKNLLIPFKLILAIHDAKKMLKEIKPDIIFSKGGFVSVPTVIAGKKLGLPIVSHESDLSMGLANKIILKKCDIMCTSFEETAKVDKKCVYTGQPIRKKVFRGDKSKIQSQGNFDSSLPNLLVVGGSLGAKFINEKVWSNLDKLTQEFNVIHITGKQAKEKHSHKNYLQISYAENIGDFFAWSDIVLSRAGAGAINEFVALRKPALLIPLSKRCSRGDQIENAKLYNKKGLADILEEEDFDDMLFMIKLKNLYKNAKNYIKNMEKMQSFDASEKIVKILEKTAQKNMQK